MIAAGDKLLKKTSLREYKVKSFRIDGNSRFITVGQTSNPNAVETMVEEEIYERFYVELKEHEDEIIKQNQKKSKKSKTKKLQGIGFYPNTHKGVN